MQVEYRYRGKNKHATRNRDTWEPWEDEKIREEVVRGILDDEGIGILIGRSRGAVQSRRLKLKLPLNRNISKIQFTQGARENGALVAPAFMLAEPLDEAQGALKDRLQRDVLMGGQKVNLLDGKVARIQDIIKAAWEAKSMGSANG